MLAVDLHSDLQLDIARPGQDPARAFQDRHLPALREGQIAVTILSTFSPPPAPTEIAFRYLAATRAAGCRIATTSAEMKSESPCFVLGLEGVEPYGDDLQLIEAFHWAGIRVVGLVWMHQNAVTGAGNEPNPGGLTSFGIEVLRVLQELGAIVDLAHISDLGFVDVLERYQGPVMCSHACARALHNHPRNITDEQARLLAERGGIVGVCFFGGFLDADPARRTVARLADHIEHLLGIVGEDAIGIGPDWCGYAWDLIQQGLRLARHADTTAGYPPGLSDGSGLHLVKAVLEERGLPADKILYENALRFLGQSLEAAA